MYASSGFYFYSTIIINFLGYLYICSFFNSVFPGAEMGKMIPFLGMLVALLLNIARWRSYRRTPQRIKSALPVMFFIFGWLSAVLFFAEGKSVDTFFNWILYIYCLLGLPSLAYWTWRRYRDDRVSFLWYLFGIWFILLCAFVSTERRLLIFFSAMVAFWSMDILKKRIREGTYVKPRGKGASRNYTYLLTDSVILLFAVISPHIFLLPQNHVPRGIPGIVALYSVVSSYFASEYVLYTLTTCDLIKVE